VTVLPILQWLYYQSKRFFNWELFPNEQERQYKWYCFIKVPTVDWHKEQSATGQAKRRRRRSLLLVFFQPNRYCDDCRLYWALHSIMEHHREPSDPQRFNYVPGSHTLRPGPLLISKFNRLFGQDWLTFVLSILMIFCRVGLWRLCVSSEGREVAMA